MIQSMSSLSSTEKTIVWEDLFPYLFFDETSHTYMVNNQILTPVTKWCSQFKEPFNAAMMSIHCSQKEDHEMFGKDPKEIRALWNKKGADAAELGRQVHSMIEDYMHGIKTLDHILKGKSDQAKNLFKTWGQWWMRNKDQYDVEVSEYKVFNQTWGIAGTIDCIVRHKATGQRFIIDWKTGEKDLDDKPFKGKSLFAPFKDVPDNKIGNYSLQTSVYASILKSAEVQVDRMFILHIREDGHTVLHDTFDVREMVVKYLTMMSDG